MLSCQWHRGALARQTGARRCDPCASAGPHCTPAQRACCRSCWACPVWRRLWRCCRARASCASCRCRAAACRLIGLFLLLAESVCSIQSHQWLHPYVNRCHGDSRRRCSSMSHAAVISTNVSCHIPQHSDLRCRLPQVQECGLQVTERQAPRLHTLFAAACEAVGLESAGCSPAPSGGAARGACSGGPRLFVLSSPETAIYCTRMPVDEAPLPGRQQQDLLRSQQPQHSAADGQAGGLAAGSAYPLDLPGAVMTEAAVRRSTLTQLHRHTCKHFNTVLKCISLTYHLRSSACRCDVAHFVPKDVFKLQHHNLIQLNLPNVRIVLSSCSVRAKIACPNAGR